jgi:hypothetical protein
MLRLFKAIRPKQGFNVDEPPTSSKHTAALFAMVRNNGRILDEFKCVLGGFEVIEADFSLGLLFEDPVVAEFTAKIQRWPRDIVLRKGLLLLSGPWQDFKWTSSPQKKTSSTSKNEIYELSPIFCGHFCPPRSGSNLWWKY